MADLDPLAQDLTPLFELGAPLGRGADRAVHRARDRSSRREVALKLLHAEHKASTIERFVREATVTARLAHPGIVRVHAVGRFGGSPCIVYELVEGVGFEEALRTLDAPQRAALVRDAAVAVGAAHAQGILHRDLKPANLLVDRAGRVRVTDFGLASFEGADRLTRTGAMIGTPCYMAPELFSRGSDGAGAATDVWALGVVLYEALTGRLPFDAASFTSLVVQIDKGDVTPPRSIDPRITPALEAVCLRALASDPARRPADAAALARELDVALTDGRVPSPGPGRLVGVALGLALAVGLAVVAFRPRAEEGPPAGVPPPPTVATTATAQAPPAVAQVEVTTSTRPFAAGTGTGWAVWIDDERVLSGGADEDLRVWSAATGELLRTWRVRADAAGWALNNLYVTSPGDRHVRRLNLETGDAQSTGIVSVDALGATTRSGRLPVLGTSGALVFDESITPAAMVLAPTPGWVAAALSPDHGLLAVSDERGVVSIFEVSSVTRLRAQHEVGGAIGALFFVDAATLVVSSGARLRVFDAAQGTELPPFARHSGTIRALARSPDGARLISAAAIDAGSTELKVWDMKTRQALADQAVSLPGSPQTLDVSPDGRSLALRVRDGAVHVRPLR
jgi:hypothetical protein